MSRDRDDAIAAMAEFIEPEDDEFLSCTNCGLAFPIDSMGDDEDCYRCGGVLAIRVM
jgi:rRNA maturation endonuclease Nob1